jgi:Uma2 family endonuclease
MYTETLVPPRTMMEVFKSLPEGTLVQLIENKLIMSPAPLTKHQLLLMELSSNLFEFTKKGKLGKVFPAPYDVFIDRKNVFQPDICFIGNDKKHLINTNGFYGAPDLIIEILSPTTAKYDIEDKKDVYERNGVQEYWIIDPATNESKGYQLINGEYQLFYEKIGSAKSQLLDWEIVWEME